MTEKNRCGEVRDVIRIAIVEDEEAVREQLIGYVQRYTRQYGTVFDIKTFSDGVEILEDYRPVYDLVLLDVEMKHLDGMETARKIRELDPDVMLIFITNMAQYAIKGYAVGALDYYLESEGHRVHFYTEEGDFAAPGALKALEEKLADRPFARCNSGYLVNLAQVQAVQQNTVQVGPYELQVSRPKRKSFLAALTDYIGGDGL